MTEPRVRHAVNTNRDNEADFNKIYVYQDDEPEILIETVGVK